MRGAARPLAPSQRVCRHCGGPLVAPVIKPTEPSAAASRAAGRARILLNRSRYCTQACAKSAKVVQRRERRARPHVDRAHATQQIRDVLVQLARTYESVKGQLDPTLETKLAEIADLIF